MYAKQVDNLVAAARQATSVQQTVRLLEQALDVCKQWVSSAGGPSAAVHAAQIHGELAFERDNAAARAQEWQEALKVLAREFSQRPASEVATAYASLAVDAFQDILSSATHAERLKELRVAKGFIDRSIDTLHSASARQTELSGLLASKSMLLRHLALVEGNSRTGLARVRESERCARRASEHFAEPHILIELAMATWALARYATSDAEYERRLKRAEEILLTESVRASELGQLALARFLRMTYRPLEACDSFPKSLATAINRRRILRESVIFAESVIQLWYWHYPKDAVDERLEQARQLLEMAQSSGYSNPRLLLNLAFVIAILDGPQAGEIVLAAMWKASGLEWRQIQSAAALDKTIDPLVKAMGLGMNNGSTWCKLGAYVQTFLKNDEFARSLYEIALRLSPHDPITLTNLARVIAEKGTAPSLAEAKRLLQKARSFADRRFVWWKSVQRTIESREAKSRLAQSPNIADEFVDKAVENIKDLAKRLRQIKALADATRRGYELESLFWRLAEIALGNAEPSYRTIRDELGLTRQVDGYFEHRYRPYRVECKWEATEVTPDKIALFEERLNAAGVSGLFLSMSGFTTEAVGRAKQAAPKRPILLMDGEELEAVLSGEVRFDVLLAIKRTYFDKRSDPYFRVVATGEMI